MNTIDPKRARAMQGTLAAQLEAAVWTRDVDAVNAAVREADRFGIVLEVLEPVVHRGYRISPRAEFLEALGRSVAGGQTYKEAIDSIAAEQARQLDGFRDSLAAEARAERSSILKEDYRQDPMLHDRQTILAVLTHLATADAELAAAFDAAEATGQVPPPAVAASVGNDSRELARQLLAVRLRSWSPDVFVLRMISELKSVLVQLSGIPPAEVAAYLRQDLEVQSEIVAEEEAIAAELEAQQ